MHRHVSWFPARTACGIAAPRNSLGQVEKSAKSFVFLLFAEKFDVRRAGKQASRSSAFNQGLDRLLATFAIAERPAVDVHADKLIGNFGFHVAGKLHGIV